MENFYNVKNLFIEDNISSDTSLVFVQGGFRRSLVNDKSLDVAKLEAASYYYVEFARWFEKKVCKKINFVAAKQFQHLNPEGRFNCSSEHDALKKLEKNIELLAKVIDYQIKNGKKVILMGHSYGGMLVQEYVERFGLDKLKKVIICNVRPYNPPLTWIVMQEKNSRLVYGMKGQIIKIMPKAYSRKATLMMVPLIKKDYTKLWKGKDLSKVHYIVADGDSYIGNISNFEEKFIISHGGSVIRCRAWRSKLLSLLSLKKASPENIAHHIVFTPMTFPYMRKLVNEDAIVSKFTPPKKQKIKSKNNISKDKILNEKLRRKAKKTEEWKVISDEMKPHISNLRNTKKSLKNSKHKRFCKCLCCKSIKSMKILNKKRKEKYPFLIKEKNK